MASKKSFFKVNLREAKEETPKKRKGSTLRQAEERREYERNRKRIYRARMSEEQKQKKREKDTEYNRNKRKKLEDMGDREKRRIRKLGRERTNRFQEKKKILINAERLMNADTPPGSDNENEEIPDANINLPSKRTSGKKKKNRNRSKIYRDYKKALSRLKLAELRSERFRKKLKRLEKKSTCQTTDSEIGKILTTAQIPKEIVKKLLCANEVMQHLESKKLQLTPRSQEYVNFAKFIAAPKLKNMKLINQAKTIITYRMYNKVVTNSLIRKRRKDAIPESIKGSVKAFYEEDINSRLCPGKNEFKNRNGQKIQKRILLDSIINLHKKYNQNHRNIAYSTFALLRPFHVVPPKLSDRDTCVCIKHANMRYMIEKLAAYRIIKNMSPLEVIRPTVCDINSKSCMYGQCNSCRWKKINYDINEQKKRNFVKYYEWSSQIEVRNIKNKEAKVKFMARKEVRSTIEQLMLKVDTEMISYRKHIHDISHQYSTIKKLKTELNDNEIFLHIDFSENYVLKYNREEVQAVHFGASQKQISLHTGVYYVKLDGLVKPHSFCTVSENLDHGAYAIWAHMTPLLTFLKQEYPDIENYHFQSDGPLSQYKNKFNIHLLVNYLPELNTRIKQISWNFSVAGHGKGAADGVGGTLKRNADNLVAQGKEILSAAQFVDILSTACKNVRLYEIKTEEIENMKKNAPLCKKSIRGIASYHQICWNRSDPNLVFSRLLSCFSCSLGSTCIHFGIDSHQITKPTTTNYESEDELPLSKWLNDGNNVAEDLSTCGVGSFVLVQFSVDNNEEKRKYYMGQITEEIGSFEDFHVNFMRKKKTLGEPYFYFPQNKDEAYMNIEDILGVYEPSGSRRDRFYFNLPTHFDVS